MGQVTGEETGFIDASGWLLSSRAPVETFYRMAGCSFLLRGSGGLVEHVRRECRSLAVPMLPSVDIEFDFRRQLPSMPSYSLAGTIKIGASYYEARSGRVSYQVHSTADGFLVYVLNDVPRRRPIPNPIRRFHDWNFQVPEENAAKDFLYGVFGYLTQLVNMRRGCSYLHASSFERRGEGIALIAWRGIGKTAAMLKLVGEHGWNYLSDDLAVIGPPRELSRSAQRIQLYAYNLAGEDNLTRRIFSHRSYWDRCAWEFRKHWHGVGQTRRRVDAEELFGEAAVSVRATLRSPVLMERSNVSGFEMEPISTAELAHRSAYIILRELESLVEIASAVNAFGPGFGAMAPDIFLTETSDLLEDRFEGLAASRLRIPIEATAASLAEYLQATFG